jgi:two-component system phosphate regulon sensor histidine kinase PhoR
LAAIQASPNGVVLLDSEGRIEWCNARRQQHFGFDPQRDLLAADWQPGARPGFAATTPSRDYAG